MTSTLPSTPGERPTATAQITDRWDRLGGGPLGGYSLAIAVRAIDEHAAAGRNLTALTAFFHRPAHHGEASISTETVRAGPTVHDRRSPHPIRPGGPAPDRYLRRPRWWSHDGAQRTASAAAARACIDPLADLDLPGLTVAQRVEYRFAHHPGWATGAPTGVPAAECWMRFTDDRPADLLSLPSPGSWRCSHERSHRSLSHRQRRLGALAP